MLAVTLFSSVPAQALTVGGNVPVQIDIPKIGAHAAVVPLGQDDDGSMSAPSDPDTVGWFAPGPGIGAPGNALLDGHVDWGGSLRVFGLLRDLEPGDSLQVTDANGDVFGYSVQWIQLYPADGAPVADIFRQTGQEEITLITCGGAFDRSAHRYVARWVVRAVRAY
jgi:sortase (surface protein transpeptidase)